MLPSPCQYISTKIKRTKTDILVDGIEMGGYPVSRALIDHVKKDFKVYVYGNAWKTIKYDRNYVLNTGIEIIDNKETYYELLNKENITRIQLTDVEIEYFFDIFQKFEIDSNFDFIGVAVQDHGVPDIKNDDSKYDKENKEDKSSKVSKINKERRGAKNFRHDWMVSILEKSPEFNSFLFRYDEVPEFLSRSREITRYLNRKTGVPVFVVDTVIAASKGCLYNSVNVPNIIAIDIGNGHTCGFSVSGNEILGYFEYHTASITPEKLEYAVNKLINGDLSNEEIQNMGGHGAYVRKSIKSDYKIIVTGPRRNIIKKSKLEYVLGAPFGDHMITGAVGILKMILERVNSSID